MTREQFLRKRGCPAEIIESVVALFDQIPSEHPRSEWPFYFEESNLLERAGYKRERGELFYALLSHTTGIEGLPVILSRFRQ